MTQYSDIASCFFPSRPLFNANDVLLLHLTVSVSHEATREPTSSVRPACPPCSSHGRAWLHHPHVGKGGQSNGADNRVTCRATYLHINCGFASTLFWWATCLARQWRENGCDYQWQTDRVEHDGRGHEVRLFSWRFGKGNW